MRIAETALCGIDILLVLVLVKTVLFAKERSCLAPNPASHLYHRTILHGSADIVDSLLVGQIGN